MTARRLPRSPRGRALPRRSGTDTVAWPPALRGRSSLLCLMVLGWLGGGLLATAIAAVTVSPTDLTYGVTTTAAALVGLLVLALAPRGSFRRDRRSAPLPLDEPVPVPVQAEPDHDDRRAPALR